VDEPLLDEPPLDEPLPDDPPLLEPPLVPDEPPLLPDELPAPCDAPGSPELPEHATTNATNPHKPTDRIVLIVIFRSGVRQAM